MYKRILVAISASVSTMAFAALIQQGPDGSYQGCSFDQGRTWESCCWASGSAGQPVAAHCASPEQVAARGTEPGHGGVYDALPGLAASASPPEEKRNDAPRAPAAASRDGH